MISKIASKFPPKIHLYKKQAGIKVAKEYQRSIDSMGLMIDRSDFERPRVRGVLISDRLTFKILESLSRLKKGKLIV